MLRSSLFSTRLCFLLLCIITRITSTNALNRDIISTTCKQCTNRTVNYDFCLASLQKVPISHFTDLRGLAIITMELALKNATTSILTIGKMMTSGKFNPSAKQCLTDCFELYVDGVSVLVDSAAAFFGEQYYVAETLMAEVMDLTEMCGEGFKEKGEVTPLTKENYNLLQLSDIAMCIIDLISLARSI